jgi:hypothetical protein
MPNPQAGGPPLVVSIAAYSIYSQLTSKAGGRPFHPQPEDAQRCGDKGGHLTWLYTLYLI